MGDLLETDCDVAVAEDAMTHLDGVNGTARARHRVPGQAQLWRLILLDRDMLSLFPSSCSPYSEASRTAHQVSISQGRLLRILPRLAALNIRAVTRTPHPDLLPLADPVADEAGNGLLQWAAVGMVDRSDILMHLNLIDFFETFVSLMRVSGRSEGQDEAVMALVRTAVQGDEELETALRGLPDRTVEEEAEPLRMYITEMLESVSL